MDEQSDPAIPVALLRQFYAYDRDLPLEAVTAEAPGLDFGPGLRAERFEITSTHDARVPGLVLWDPAREGPRPAVLVAHPATLGKSDDYVLWPASEWAERGAVCVLIDQAGHGERATRPITMEDFMRYPQRRAAMTQQTAVDWMRALDYALTRPQVDGERVGFVGFSMGGMRGAPFVGLDGRVGAAVFCISGAAQPLPASAGEAERIAQQITDPATFAPLMDRPTLVVAGRRDDIVPPASAERFFAAMPEPREIHWGPYGHWDFMPAGLSPVWPFLERQLFG